MRSSRRVGFTICFTEIRLTSSEVKNENETLVIVEGTGWEIFMTD